jgi:glutamyl-tRNA reductase
VRILLTGLNHETAPLETRERVSFSKEQLSDALPLLAERVGEGVILSTCNRMEVYTVAEEPPEAAGEVRRFLAYYHGIDQQTLAPHLYDHTDADAVSHLFRVASGLDSMIVGESQILGQVRAALTAAAESQTLSSPLSRLFHRAIRTGRKVREETDVGRNALSMSYASVQLAQRVMGNLAGLRVLLIGAGEAGQMVAQALRATGAGDLMIANRTQERGEELAHSLGGRAVRLSEVGPSLASADIVIAATEAPDYVLTEDAIANANDDRHGRPVFLFDLSVPRNIEPRAGSIDGVSLFNIDDLSSIAEENLEGRKEAAAEAEKIVEGEVSRFIRWWDSLESVPLIKDLRQRAERIRKRELARALRSLQGLSPQDVEKLDAMTRSIINRLLHDPTISLKQRTGKAHLQAARDLFRLWDVSE